MITLKYFLGLVFFSFLALNVYAGTKLPVDANGEVVYHQSFKFHTSYSDEAVYNLLQDWFSTETQKFTCQNEQESNCSCANKALVDREFNNAQPLQSLDPSSGRMCGKGLIKYYGGAGSSIGALYMEYYIVLEVKNHQLTATISKLKYHNYNQHTYAAKPIFGWQGGKPYDSADRLENLINEQSEARDIQELGAFVNQNITALLGNLQSFLQNKALLETHVLAKGD